jgi:DNA invertase Pin-like site-specific DNA recombinase
MRLLAYTRVSGQIQADNTSLGVQQDKIDGYCKAFGHEIAATYSEVCSGADLESRPKFQQLLRDLPDYDGMIVANLDRVGRSANDILNITADFDRRDKVLIVIDYQLDTSTPTGKLMRTMLAGLAEFERDMIKQRCQAGIEAKKQAGQYYGGAPPYGYKALDGALVEDEFEQSVLAKMKSHRKSGKSYRAVTEWLNDNGFTTRKGHQWYETSVKRAIKGNR